MYMISFSFATSLDRIENGSSYAKPLIEDIIDHTYIIYVQWPTKHLVQCSGKHTFLFKSIFEFFSRIKFKTM